MRHRLLCVWVPQRPCQTLTWGERTIFELIRLGSVLATEAWPPQLERTRPTGIRPLDEGAKKVGLQTNGEWLGASIVKALEALVWHRRRRDEMATSGDWRRSYDP